MKCSLPELTDEKKREIRLCFMDEVTNDENVQRKGENCSRRCAMEISTGSSNSGSRKKDQGISIKDEEPWKTTGEET